MFGSFATTHMSIPLQLDQTLVILFEHGTFHTKTLSVKKMACPQDLGQDVMHPNQLALSGAA